MVLSCVTRPKLVDLGGLSLKSLNAIIPSDAETRSIKASLAIALSELHQLESNISHTQRKLASFSARRDHLLDQTERYRIAIAPYKRLPPEILIEIFLACLPEHVQLPPSVDEAPLSLTRICSSWRALALNAQELWNKFQVGLCARPLRNHAALTSFQVWLNRCPDRPLSFKVTTAPRAPFPLPGLTHSILPVDLILPYTTRIRKLDMQNISGEQMTSLISLPMGAFPLLEEIDIFLRDSWLYRSLHREEEGEGEEGRQASTAFRGAEKLKKVTLRGFDGTFNPAHLNLPWRQLKVLNIDTLPSDAVGCHEMLRVCERVEEVSVRIMRIEESTWRLMGSLPVTRLTELKTLAIRFESTDYHGKFLDPFEVPALCVLQTRFDWRRGGNNHQNGDHSIIDNPSSFSTSSSFTRKSNSYNDLIERSNCPIQTLHIGRNAPDYDLEELLTVATRLRELSMEDYLIVPSSVWERMGRGEIGRGIERMMVSVKEVDPVLGMLEARMAMMAVEEYECQESGLNDGGLKVFKEMKLGCPKPTFQQRWKMECLEKLGLRIVLCHYGFFV